MIRGKRYRGQELEIWWRETLGNGYFPFVLRPGEDYKMQVAGAPRNYKRCEVRSIPEREKKGQDTTILRHNP